MTDTCECKIFSELRNSTVAFEEASAAPSLSSSFCDPFFTIEPRSVRNRRSILNAMSYHRTGSKRRKAVIDDDASSEDGTWIPESDIKRKTGSEFVLQTRRKVTAKERQNKRARSGRNQHEEFEATAASSEDEAPSSKRARTQPTLAASAQSRPSRREAELNSLLKDQAAVGGPIGTKRKATQGVRYTEGILEDVDDEALSGLVDDRSGRAGGHIDGATRKGRDNVEESHVVFAAPKRSSKRKRVVSSEDESVAEDAATAQPLAATEAPANAVKRQKTNLKDLSGLDKDFADYYRGQRVEIEDLEREQEGQVETQSWTEKRGIEPTVSSRIPEKEEAVVPDMVPNVRTREQIEEHNDRLHMMSMNASEARHWDAFRDRLPRVVVTQPGEEFCFQTGLIVTKGTAASVAMPKTTMASSPSAETAASLPTITVTGPGGETMVVPPGDADDNYDAILVSPETRKDRLISGYKKVFDKTTEENVGLRSYSKRLEEENADWRTKVRQLLRQEYVAGPAEVLTLKDDLKTAKQRLAQRDLKLALQLDEARSDLRVVREERDDFQARNDALQAANADLKEEVERLKAEQQ